MYIILYNNFFKTNFKKNIKLYYITFFFFLFLLFYCYYEILSYFLFKFLYK